MKWLRSARQPMTFCTPFRSRIGPIRVMAKTFFRVGFDASLGDDEAQEHASRDSKHALHKVEFHPLNPEAIKRDPEIGYKVVRLPGFHNDVVDIRLYSPPDMVSKHVEHTSLVCNSGVSKAKGHRDVAVHAERGNKRSRAGQTLSF